MSNKTPKTKPKETIEVKKHPSIKGYITTNKITPQTTRSQEPTTSSQTTAQEPTKTTKPDIASKRMNVVTQNFLTFPKYQKQKFWKNLNSNFFTLSPSEGGTKKTNIFKLSRRA